MSFDPLSWAIGWALSKFADKATAHARASKLEDRLRDVVRAWSADLPDTAHADPDAVFPALSRTVDDAHRPALCALRARIRTTRLPGRAIWRNALLEQWHSIRNSAQSIGHLQSFFQLREELASEHLSELAGRLVEVLGQDETMFKRTVLDALDELKRNREDERSQGLSWLRGDSALAINVRSRESQNLLEANRDFLGRTFLLQEIDARVRDGSFPGGYILIRGEPGIGKTALIAHLVGEYGHVHHFNSVVENVRSTGDFLTNICSQLILRFDLPHSALPPEARESNGFLLELLMEARGSTEHPVIVLVDALDEADDAEHSAGANRLLLPRNVPDGVYFVVTVREEYDPRLDVERCEEIHLRDDDPRNRSDIENFIHRYIEDYHSQMEIRLDAWGVDTDEFVSVMAGKSEGNFMYIVHVLRDIRDARIGRKSLEDIRDLPAGLRGYYRRHWRMMRDRAKERFELLYQPIVCFLAAAQEPVDIPRITEWIEEVAGTVPPWRVEELINEWRQFLNAFVGEDGNSFYRVYHRSFQEFLEEEVGLRRYHDWITRVAIAKVPGLEVE